MEKSNRTVAAPALFANLPMQLRETILAGAVRRKFAHGQLVQHRGDPADGFWVIDSGQVKLGRYREHGDMQVLVILGSGDSFGELACLGGFAKVADVEAIGALEMLWVSDAGFSAAIASSPIVAREILRGLASQLQEALDNLLVLRNLPASKRMVRMLLALCQGKQAPVTVVIRQQELAELVGVTRMTIATALAQVESASLLKRQYRSLVIPDPDALRIWLRES